MPTFKIHDQYLRTVAWCQIFECLQRYLAFSARFLSGAHARCADRRDVLFGEIARRYQGSISRLWLDSGGTHADRAQARANLAAFTARFQDLARARPTQCIPERVWRSAAHGVDGRLDPEGLTWHRRKFHLRPFVDSPPPSQARQSLCNMAYDVVAQRSEPIQPSDHLLGLIEVGCAELGELLLRRARWVERKSHGALSHASAPATPEITQVVHFWLFCFPPSSP